MYSEAKRVEYLDTIRGLAALFVLLSHTALAFAWLPVYGSVLSSPFVSILFDGKAAVCMFFVLSGYVLSKPYIASAQNPEPRQVFLPTFYLRRFTRIWLPWFFIFLASTFARHYCFSHPPTQPPVSHWLQGFWQTAMTGGDFLRQCAFQLHDPARQLLNQDWSLGVELKGSLLIPLFLFLLRGRRPVALALLAVAFPIGVGTGHYYVSFIIGVLVARFGEGFVDWFHSSRRPAKVALLVAGLILYQAFGVVVRQFPDSWPAYKCGWIASSLGCALVLLAAFSSRSLQRGLSCRPAVFLGRISYSVYLVQFIIILCCLPPLVHLLNQRGVAGGPCLFVATLVSSVCLTLLLSTVTYHLIEVPAINVGHFLSKRIQARWPA